MRILFLLCFLGAILGSIPATTHAKPSFSIKASKALIDEICKSTTNPPFCLNFLNSDPRSATASVKGLAQISIEKAESNAKTAVNLIAALLRNAKDPRLKGKYESCLENFNDAISSLDDAKAALVSGGPSDVNNYASAALTDVDTCGEDFPEEDPQLKEATQTLENIISVILAISKHLTV